MRSAVSEQGQDWLAPVTGVVSSATTGFLLWLGHRLVGKAAFQTALNNGFAQLAADLRKELDAEREENRGLKKEIVQLKQTVGSMERLLHRYGYVPAPHSNIDIEDRLAEIIPLGKEVGDANS